MRKPKFKKAERVRITRGPDKEQTGVVQAVSKGAFPKWLVTQYLIKMDDGRLVQVSQAMLEIE